MDKTQTLESQIFAIRLDSYLVHHQLCGDVENKLPAVSRENANFANVNMKFLLACIMTETLKIDKTGEVSHCESRRDDCNNNET